MPAAELGAHMEQLAASPVGLRLGLLPFPDEAVAGAGTARANAVRSWGTRALLLDRLVTLEARVLASPGPGLPTTGSTAFRRPARSAQAHRAKQRPSRCYRANSYRYRVPERRRVRHVLLRDRHDAEAVYREASGAGELADLAVQSLDAGTRTCGGDLGWVERGQLAGALEEAIFAAELGRGLRPG